MNIYEVKKYYCEYTKPCPCCQKVCTVYTQNDNCPEYVTDVLVVCTCGEWVLFQLPVN